MNWPFWSELFLRSAVLLAAAETLRRLSRLPAALRHTLLLWSLILLALLPVLSVLFPEVHIPLWTVQTRREQVTLREVSSTVIPTSHGHATSWPLVIWLTGVLLGFAPVLVGATSAWKVARRALPLAGSAIQNALEGIPLSLSPDVEVLVSDELSLPLTCGLWRRRILLPATAKDWTPSRLYAVLLHEIAHVRRRDVAAQVAAHLVAAMWWFQPLVWMVRRSLRAESELACDAEALRSGFRPSHYAAELLGVAKGIGSNHMLSSSAISMARPSDLEHRLRAILKPAVGSLSRSKTYALALTLGTVAIAASAITLGPKETSGELGGSTMKRTIMSGLLTSVGLSAATLTGIIHDPSGVPIADAKVLVYNPDSHAKQETVTGSDGKFSFDGTGAGQYILRVEKPGFTSILRGFDLKAESKMDRNLTMTTDGGQSVADEVKSTDDSSQRSIRIGGQVAQANLSKKVQPVYPAAAKAAGTQGVVEIETTISKDGVPVELRVVSSPNRDLSEASLEAVRQWRYRPTLLNGEPVEVVTDVIVNYTLAP
ncbi:MAG: TonB family protein [Bryobacterales bacterium]|nr:TonB family protein [Bryobacterales bacterium]